jgi:hypothetical protein
MKLANRRSHFQGMSNGGATTVILSFFCPGNSKTDVIIFYQIGDRYLSSGICLGGLKLLCRFNHCYQQFGSIRFAGFFVSKKLDAYPYHWERSSEIWNWILIGIGILPFLKSIHRPSLIIDYLSLYSYFFICLVV